MATKRSGAFDFLLPSGTGGLFGILVSRKVAPGRTISAVALIAALLFSSILPARAATSMAQVAPGVGWAVQYGHLYWTNDDGGKWADITPQDSASHSRQNRFDSTARDIGGVFFLDSSHGWILLAVGDKQNTWIAAFDLASTSDGGATWALTRIAVPSLGVGQEYAGSCEIFFLDSTHGWINLQGASSVQFPWGVLIATENGGATWDLVGNAQGSVGNDIGAMVFTNAQVGWIAGGADGQHLFVTRDGGKVWQQQLVTPPPAVIATDPKPIGRYALPAFKDADHGLLPVVYSVRNQAGQDLEILAVFSTIDGGRTWEADGTAGLGEDMGLVAVQAVDSAAVAVKPPAYGASVAAVQIQLGQGTATTPSSTQFPKNTTAQQISFLDTLHGWARADGSGRATLLSTGDGGATWKDVTPVKPKPTAQLQMFFGDLGDLPVIMDFTPARLRIDS